MKFLYKKIVAFVAIIAVVALGLSVIKPVSAATVSPTVTNLKAQASGQKVTFSFDWDLTGKSVKEGDTFTIDAPEGVNITEVATQSLQANGAEVATISMTNKKITFTFKKAIESMNQNVKGGFSYKAEWDNTPGNPGNKTATSKVGSESVVITRPDGPGVFESVLNKYNLTGDYVTKQFKLDASENYAWLNVGDDYYLTKWFIRINGDGKKQALTNPVVSDKIQAPAVDYSKITFAPAANHAASEFFVGTYLKPSFTLRKGGQVVASGWDFWKHVKFDADGNGFTVNLSDVSDVFKTASSDELIVEYQTLIPKTTIRVDNNATLTADEITTPQTDPAFWNNTELNFWVTGDKTVTVQKEWVGDSEADRKDITVQLLANGQKLDGMTKTLTKASGWTAEFSKLPGIKDGQPIVYSVEETNTPDGYTSKVEPINESNVIKVVNTSNKPKVTETTANLVVKKAFEVAGDQEHTKLPITEGQFEFVLKDENKKVVETAKNQADGTVNFKSLTFNKEGSYTYTITENKGTDASVNYSTQSITATVDVKKTDDKLVATVTYSGGDGEQKNTITNTQNKPKVSNAKVTLNLKKAFEGGELKGDDFEFVAKDANDQVVDTAKNQKNGSITFDNITVDKAGTFKYTITETKGTDKTITYSDKTITATVVVVEKDNALVVEQATYSDGQTGTDTFTNKKEAPKTESVKATLQVNKLLKEGETSLPLTDDQFEFVLKEGNNTLETAKNKANGTVTFKDLSYSEEGTHTYTITENKGTDASINYSTQSITATVDVKKANDKLVATVTYSGGDAEKGDTFTNTKTPPTPVPPTVKPTTAQFKAKKVLAINGSSDRTLKANEFTFLLKDQNGTLVDTKTNGENGDILFNPVTFNEAGTFTYTIVEQKPATPESAITYDESVHTVTVTVTKDETGQLNADVQYDGKKDTPTFTNTYTPPTPPTPSEKQITTSKILEGRDLQGGEFSFNLLDENGTVLQTKQNAADGTVTFDAIAYTEAMIGTHKYTIKEVVPADQANIQYDEGQVDVTVTVTKDEASNAIQAVVSYGAKKTFINKVIPPTPPTVNNPELKLYTLRVRKVDEKGDYLAGAVFGLFEADGVTPVANPYGQGQAQAISGQDGLASFVGFEAKDYVTKELSAPSGYQLSNEVIKVSVSDYVAATNLVVDKGNVVNKLLPPPPSTDIPNIPTPSNSKPKTPSPNGDKPKSNDKPKSSETPKSSDKPKENKKSLPSTGTEDHLGLLVTGLTFVATAIASMTLKKKEDF
ncbi:T surface-antigen of pili [Streptococcus parasanguinis]|uniref:Spy0128 family protein n=1 Tax=Streptococcus parasanguinis TaxID=1318 RepID=UPI000F7AE729|nr:FctA domain-containing protein [Streptococcus parasanguinis]MCP8990283.1 SpaA isopeptide-forming pilin-related protein [Streptococcus parasanguinis]MCP8991978.1 SpaA isopeptide-forming pilin-related protein [Streptococcus parasanguinis]MCP9003068.1 SpaA isopeptide-forming pilin-related protein [Streptococcus parasanguinis]MCP9009332.1 SpaA isopeptide-forming pilin-related protein [Streptococcus parasanguinis]MCP9033558.1 SpaA isopeptide-forming pilin-related protein [Streptococcus parasangu